jgi:hypothetical protein
MDMTANLLALLASGLSLLGLLRKHWLSLSSLFAGYGATLDAAYDTAAQYALR